MTADPGRTFCRSCRFLTDTIVVEPRAARPADVCGRCGDPKRRPRPVTFWNKYGA